MGVNWPFKLYGAYVKGKGRKGLKKAKGRKRGRYRERKRGRG